MSGFNEASALLGFGAAAAIPLSRLIVLRARSVQKPQGGMLRMSVASLGTAWVSYLLSNGDFVAAAMAGAASCWLLAKGLQQSMLRGKTTQQRDPQEAGKPQNSQLLRERVASILQPREQTKEAQSEQTTLQIKPFDFISFEAQGGAAMIDQQEVGAEGVDPAPEQADTINSSPQGIEQDLSKGPQGQTAKVIRLQSHPGMEARAELAAERGSRATPPESELETAHVKAMRRNNIPTANEEQKGADPMLSRVVDEAQADAKRLPRSGGTRRRSSSAGSVEDTTLKADEKTLLLPPHQGDEGESPIS